MQLETRSGHRRAQRQWLIHLLTRYQVFKDVNRNGQNDEWSSGIAIINFKEMINDGKYWVNAASVSECWKDSLHLRSMMQITQRSQTQIH